MLPDTAWTSYLSARQTALQNCADPAVAQRTASKVRSIEKSHGSTTESMRGNSPFVMSRADRVGSRKAMISCPDRCDRRHKLMESGFLDAIGLNVGGVPTDKPTQRPYGRSKPLDGELP